MCKRMVVLKRVRETSAFPQVFLNSQPDQSQYNLSLLKLLSMEVVITLAATYLP